MFRPCLDLHQGKVKQIVGASLTETGECITNFETEKGSAHFAALYKKDGLRGGHVIMLGPNNESAALEALKEFPGGFHVGGGINRDNALKYLDAGASHVIVTSHVFNETNIDFQKLEDLVAIVGKNRLVLDLSCRLKDGNFYVVTNRWKTFTDFQINEENLSRLAEYCSEFLVHAVDVEGKQAGIVQELVELLARCSPIPATYAGGARSIADLDTVKKNWCWTSEPYHWQCTGYFWWPSPL